MRIFYALAIMAWLTVTIIDGVILYATHHGALSLATFTALVIVVLCVAMWEEKR